MKYLGKLPFSVANETSTTTLVRICAEQGHMAPDAKGRCLRCGVVPLCQRCGVEPAAVRAWEDHDGYVCKKFLERCHTCYGR